MKMKVFIIIFLKCFDLFFLMFWKEVEEEEITTEEYSKKNPPNDSTRSKFYSAEWFPFDTGFQ